MPIDKCNPEDRVWGQHKFQFFIIQLVSIVIIFVFKYFHGSGETAKILSHETINLNYFHNIKVELGYMIFVTYLCTYMSMLMSYKYVCI